MKQTYQEEKCPCENEVLMCIGKEVEKGEYFCSFKLLEKKKKKDKKGQRVAADSSQNKISIG